MGKTWIVASYPSFSRKPVHYISCMSVQRNLNKGTKFYFQLSKLDRQCSNVNINQKNSVLFLDIYNGYDFSNLHELHSSKYTISSGRIQVKFRLSAPAGIFSVL